MLLCVQSEYDRTLKKTIYTCNGIMPTLRTHQSIVNAANQCELQGVKAVNGVTGRSALLRLECMNFDLIKDSLLDPMHIVSGIGGRHLLKLLKGMRTKIRGGATEERELESEDEMGSGEEITPEAELVEQSKRWKRTNREMELADKLYSEMRLPDQLAPRSTLPFQHTGNFYSAHVLLQPCYSPVTALL